MQWGRREAQVVLGRGHLAPREDFVHWLPWALSASVLWWLNMVAAVGQLLKDPMPVPTPQPGR